MIKFTYLKQPPRKYTFEMPRLKQWLEERCEGKVLNLFAGRVRLDVLINELRVDISNEFSPDYVMDAFEYINFAINHKVKFDTIILDPPYSLRKSMEKYKGKVVSKFNKILDLLPKVLNYRGKVISFGYRSIVMGKSRGFKQEEICLINHSGAFHDTIVTIERKL